MEQPRTTIQTLCIKRAITLCDDYKALQAESNDWTTMWLTRRQLSKLRLFCQKGITHDKQPSKECIEYALHIAERFYPIRADTFDWQHIYFNKKQLNQFIIFCQTNYIKPHE